MKIWVVDTKYENSCAWTKKEDAINYFLEETKNLGWEIVKQNIFEYAHYYLVKGKDTTWTVRIYNCFLDEKPYS